MSVKAFELVPAIERLQLMSDKAKTEISCLECCGKNIYIGTDDCFVIHYVTEEKTNSSGKTIFVSERQGHKYLAVKKPICQLKAASALNRLLVLCDNTLVLLNMFDLEPIVSGTKIKNVSSFCLNENPSRSNPFSIEICVALKKKSFQIYNVTEDKMTLVKDVSTAEPPVTMCIDGVYVCAALTSQYNIIDYTTGAVQDLFPYDNEHIKPLVTRISREEFLLSAPGALGMFATATGVSQRPPLQWSENLISVVFSHPYCLALNDEFITVHSILDQQQKQSIPFQGGQYLGEFDGKILIASSRDVYALVPIAVEKQIQALLADKRVKEALDLAKNARKIGLDKERFLKMYRRIQQQAGFIEFAEMHFDEARDLFHNGQLDVREIITIYPLLLAGSSRFVRSVPPLHEIADIHQLCRGDLDKVTEYKRFLVAYLEEIRGTRHTVGANMEVDTALVKLYAELRPDNLLMLVSAGCACDVMDTVSCLQKHHRYHTLALLYSNHGDADKALNVWTRIVDGDLEDEMFPGLEFIIEYLSNLNNPDLIWKYADWLLDKDQGQGVRVFIERPEAERSERLSPELIVDYLSRYPDSIITYLQHLVYTLKSENEKYHTHLAVLYLDRVLRLMQNSDSTKQQLDLARSELRHMLQTSNLYRVQLLLGKIKDMELYPECAILYGKLEEHDKALRILVHKLRDFTAAENYCLINSRGKDLSTRRRHFQLLLTVYLDPNNERRDSLVAPAVALLNNNKADFDMMKVLQLIPEHWSIGLLSQFLTSSIRKSTNGHRTTRVHRMLARGENLRLRTECMDVMHEAISLNDDRMCSVCSERFDEAAFVRYPNGIVTHTKCAQNKYVCPVTGKLFSASQGTVLTPGEYDTNHT